MESTSSSIPVDRSHAGSTSYSTAVSWGAILAGAFVAAALALILLLLGSGLGFASVSPWSHEGASAKTLGVAAIIWLIFVHLSSSAIGGYMAGRLRAMWSDIGTDEVLFRDSAHGLTAWAFGIVLTTLVLMHAAASVVGGVTKAGAAAAGAAGSTAAAGMASGAAQDKEAGSSVTPYFVDTLFRSDRPRLADDSAVREEAGWILSSGLRQETFPAGDRAYLAQTIAARTGLSQPDAEKRVSDTIAQAQAAELKARQAADAARKAAAHAALWTFLALLIGAFTAALTGTMGGRHRDETTTVPARSMR